MQASGALRLLVVGVAAAVSCARVPDYAIEGTRLAPAAVGTLDVEPVEGGVWLVSFELSHLPPPARLGAGLGSYVVWLVTDSGVRKVGRMDYSERTRRGRRWTTSPSRTFRLLVTAEADERASAPSDRVVVDRAIEAE